MPEGTDRSGHLVRALDNDTGQVLVGVIEPEGVAPLRTRRSISQLLQLDVSDIEAEMSRTDAPISGEGLRLLPPVDGAMEVWAAGVTYLVSREARVEESGDREVYRRVYDADRPELFFKASAWRAVTDGEPIGIRDDSANNVPEPEVGLVINSRGQVTGYTIVDDVSSRSIEGDNPLYLPQAKVYDGCCALGPSIAPKWLIAEPDQMGVRMTIVRGANALFSGESSTARLKRSSDELARFLFLGLGFPDGVVLATGTSVVPPLTMSLAHDDVVEIEIDGLGRQSTPVKPAAEVGVWLTERRNDPRLHFTPSRRTEDVDVCG